MKLNPPHTTITRPYQSQNIHQFAKRKCYSLQKNYEQKILQTTDQVLTSNESNTIGIVHFIKAEKWIVSPKPKNLLKTKR